jgi:deazaflavin-dependent oxidoreductase (nitroreductase family)
MTTRVTPAYRVPAHSRLTNSIIERLLRIGIPIPPMILLTVRGRRTGQLRTTPVALFQHEGHRYLFSTFGESNWVRNLRAAGEAIVTHRRRREAIAAVELTPEAAGPVLKQLLAPYLRSPMFSRALRPRFPVAPDAPVGDFIVEARRHPLFEVLHRGAQDGVPPARGN